MGRKLKDVEKVRRSKRLALSAEPQVGPRPTTRSDSQDLIDQQLQREQATIGPESEPREEPSVQDPCEVLTGLALRGVKKPSLAQSSPGRSQDPFEDFDEDGDGDGEEDEDEDEDGDVNEKGVEVEVEHEYEIEDEDEDEDDDDDDDYEDDDGDGDGDGDDNENRNDLIVEDSMDKGKLRAPSLSEGAYKATQAALVNSHRRRVEKEQLRREKNAKEKKDNCERMHRQLSQKYEEMFGSDRLIAFRPNASTIHEHWTVEQYLALLLEIQNKKTSHLPAEEHCLAMLNKQSSSTD